MPSPRIELIHTPFEEALDGYAERVLVAGTAEANRWLRFRNWGWTVRIVGGGGVASGSLDSRVSLDSGGNLLSLHLPRQLNAPFQKVPVEKEVRETATRHAHELFGQNVRNMTPTVSSEEPERVAILQWTLPAPQSDSYRRLTFSFDGYGVLRAQSELSSTRDAEIQRSPWLSDARESLRQWDQASNVRYVGPALLVPLMLTLFFKRRLYERTSASPLLATFVAIVAFVVEFRALEEEWELWLFKFLFGLLLGLLFVYPAAHVPEYYFLRLLPSRAGSYLMLLRQHLKACPAGLSLLRGCGLGAWYLGAHTALLWLLETAKLAGPDGKWMIGQISWRATEGAARMSLFPTLVFEAILTTIAASWCLLAFPAALAYRASGRPLAMVAVPAALWLVTAFSLPGASAFPLFSMFLFAGLQGLFFALVLYRYDFLTVVAAVFTVATWLRVYPAFVILHKVEPVRCTLALRPWFLVLLLGLTLYLRPQFLTAWRRLAAIFE